MAILNHPPKHTSCTPTLDKIVLCLNQFVKPQVSIRLEGYGECLKCVPDDKNKECKGYQPMNVYVMDINP